MLCRAMLGGMGVTAKLQIKPGQRVCALNVPEGIDLGLADASTTDAAVADAVIAFVPDRAALDAWAEPVLQAARRDALAWFAYPKAGQLGTDLDRDVLAALVVGYGGVRPVRQVAIDDVWSALRFRPA
jgi:hypothetical protein